MPALTTYKTLSSGNIQIVTPEPLAGPAGAALNGNAKNFTDAILALAPQDLGDILYGGALGAATILPGNTAATKKFLSQTGTGSVSAAPAWSALSAGDIPSLLATYDAAGSASTVQTNLNTHTAGTGSSVHGAVSSNSNNQIVTRDACPVGSTPHS